ncbi:hypothetical protein V6N12_009847 [Hibiscus sabdariffa]|uniref:Uncharacterized protein n=1 Tax=Hibiscus sabdariffa TaxID=183260 RepID=A0ABR2EBX2_9ROSI
MNQRPTPASVVMWSPEAEPKLYPRLKLRVQQQQQQQQQEALSLRLIGSQSKPEKENRINSPPSNSTPRITKTHLTSPTPKSLSATKDAQSQKKKQNGMNMKSNAKPGSILPPRAVLSSPDNDGMIGSINKLDCERSWVRKKRPADFVTPSSPSSKAKTDSVNQRRSPIVARCSPKIISKGSKIDIVDRSPKIAQTSPNVRK